MGTKGYTCTIIFSSQIFNIPDFSPIHKLNYNLRSIHSFQDTDICRTKKKMKGIIIVWKQYTGKIYFLSCHVGVRLQIIVKNIRYKYLTKSTPVEYDIVTLLRNFRKCRRGNMVQVMWINLCCTQLSISYGLSFTLDFQYHMDYHLL